MQDQQFLDFNLVVAPGSVKKAMSDQIARDMYRVEIGKIRVMPGFNPRIRGQAWHDHVQNIKNSILANGFYMDKPLAGFIGKEGGEDVIFLTDGESRLEAAKLAVAEGAELTHLPLVHKDRGTSAEDLTVALLQSNSGKPFTPYETSIIVKRLMGFGWEISQIAKKIGVTSKQVDDLLILAGAQREIREAVQEERVAMTMAVEMIRKHGTDAWLMIEKTLTAAMAQGKTKATARFVPGAARKKFVSKNASKLLEIASELENPDVLAALPEPIAQKIVEFMTSYREIEAEAQGAKIEAESFNLEDIGQDTQSTLKSA